MWALNLEYATYCCINFLFYIFFCFFLFCFFAYLHILLWVTSKLCIVCVQNYMKLQKISFGFLSIWFPSYLCILFSRVEYNTTQFNFMQYHSIPVNLILSIMLICFTLSIIYFLSCFIFFPNFSSTIDIFVLDFTSYDPVFVSFLFLLFVFIVHYLIFLTAS